MNLNFFPGSHNLASILPNEKEVREYATVIYKKQQDLPVAKMRTFSAQSSFYKTISSGILQKQKRSTSKKKTAAMR